AQSQRKKAVAQPGNVRHGSIHCVEVQRVGLQLKRNFIMAKQKQNPQDEQEGIANNERRFEQFHSSKV
ncbi:MAG: hypothetical protein RL110_812, partial [Bacteroidota bacterium]